MSEEKELVKLLKLMLTVTSLPAFYELRNKLTKMAPESFRRKHERKLSLHHVLLQDVAEWEELQGVVSRSTLPIARPEL